MYLLYSLIYTIAIIFLLPFEYFKRPKDIRKRWLREKFGFYAFNLETTPPYPPLGKGGNGGVVWVHAVSVGEVMAALPMLKSLKKRYPSRGIILSTITDTGQKVAREGAPEDTIIVYLPFDIVSILNTVLKRIKPEILIVIETELWPNLFRVFKENGIPVILFNGRISEGSFKGYKKVSFFMKRILSYVDFFGMQGEEYAERIRSLGANKSRVKTLGNFKFDTRPPSQIPEWTKKIKGPVIIAGSTYEREEEFLTSVYLELKKDFPDLNLIIAPRHPERFKGVEDMLSSKGISFIKRSAFSTQHLAPPPSPSLLEGEGKGGGELSNSRHSELSEATDWQTIKGMIILLDTIGELSAVYGIADIAIIGKSFKGYGGQNPLEPAYWEKPILCGPHMENFPVIKDFYNAGAALEVNEEGLYAKLKELLRSPEKAKEIGSKAQELYRRNAGAVERAMEIIARYVNEY
ncbi:MAG: 3-deoxy-D-manno-octulosonic acid transferase [Nitrospirota bacterium]|nr:3-deoxy-D-manno-octulosonic acid transferase [Nitrospirota bacterium]